MAPLDLFHATIRHRHGEQLAVGVSEWFLHTDIREGQKPQRLSFQARLGVNRPGLVLVRPDQFVVWTGAEPDGDAATIVDRSLGRI